MKKRVVITGTGCITPIGKTTKEFWENALAGKHGFGPITHFDKDLVKTSLVAQVKGFNAKETMGRKSVSVLTAMLSLQSMRLGRHLLILA